jgi:tetratricopeptide (TPR) repeat protein
VDCAQVERDGITLKYLLGKLDEEDRQAFEEHYFSCSVCYEALEADMALQSELVEDRWQVVEESSPAVWRPQWAFAAAAAVVVLVLGAVLWFRVPGPQMQPSSVLAELSEVDPPPYAPKSLRGVENQARRELHAAMAPYQKGDFTMAIPLLEAVAQAQPTHPAAHFYLGACLLLTDRPEEALESLSRAVTLGESPFLDWALFYRGKAHLHLGNRDAADDDLSEVAGRGGELAAAAQEILDRLREEEARPPQR